MMFCTTGDTIGRCVGEDEGDTVGEADGDKDGEAEGNTVGEAEGDTVGEAEGGTFMMLQLLLLCMALLRILLVPSWFHVPQSLKYTA